jgi:LacI family transcriptional regulator
VCVVDRDLGNYDVSMPDHEQGGRLQAEHLLTLGHKKFGIISGPKIADNMTLRVKGAIAAIAQSGQLMWECESGFQALSAEAVRLLREQSVTAIIAGDDLIAINICQELESLGLKVPEDVSVIGFDNISFSAVYKPSLSTIAIPLADMAKNAIEMLFDRIANSSTARCRSIVNVALIERQSTTLKR